MYIRGGGKIGYLPGDKKEPAPNDPMYAAWDAKNSMVMTWLVNSMVEEINTNYMCYDIAKDLWDNVSQMYSDFGNQSQVYEITLKLGEIRQGENSVTKNFNTLKSLWQDLDLFNDYEWKCPEDCNFYKKIVENNRIFKFLAGLNVEMRSWGELLADNRFPLLERCLLRSIVRKARQVMLGKKPQPPSIENSALIVGSVGGRGKKTEDKKSTGSVWCDYCNKARHTRET